MSIQNSAVRFAIIAYAEVQVFWGAHYLKGADGCQPDYRDGLEGRNITLREDSTLKHLAVHAAMNGNRACHGRYRTVGGDPLFKDPDMRKIEQYQKSLAESNLPPSQYPAFDKGLFPRRDPEKQGGIYLGEDCRGKRHFDCESFMAWCISSALNDTWTNWKYGVHVYDAGLKGKLEITRQADGFPDKLDLLNGDILIRRTEKGEHMAFVTAKGSKVIEASDAKHGVVVSTYSPSLWTAHARIKNEYL